MQSSRSRSVRSSSCTAGSAVVRARRVRGRPGRRPAPPAAPSSVPRRRPSHPPGPTSAPERVPAAVPAPAPRAARSGAHRQACRPRPRPRRRPPRPRATTTRPECRGVEPAGRQRRRDLAGLVVPDRPVERPFRRAGRGSVTRSLQAQQLGEARRLVRGCRRGRQDVLDPERLRDRPGRRRRGRSRLRPGDPPEPVDVAAPLAERVGTSSLVVDGAVLGSALVPVAHRGRQRDRGRVRDRARRRHRRSGRDAVPERLALVLDRRLRVLRRLAELVAHVDRLGRPGILVGLGSGRSPGRGPRPDPASRSPTGGAGTTGAGATGAGSTASGSNGSGSGAPVSRAARSASRRSRREGHSSAPRGAPKMSAALRRPRNGASEPDARRASRSSAPSVGPDGRSGSRASSGRSPVTRSAPGRPVRSRRSRGSRPPRSAPSRRCRGRRRRPLRR